MKKAIGLLRVSSEAQAHEARAGLPSQRREAEGIAARHGLEVVEWVELAGVSGSAVLDDDRFLALLQRIEDPDIHGVILAALDRLMRPEDPGYYRIFARFRDTGTVLYTGSGARDFRSDRLLMMLETEIASLERDKIRERTMLGKELLRQQGRNVSGRHAYGTDYRDGQWRYVWPEAGVVQQAYEAVLAGERNLSDLARRLGLPRGSLRRILANPIYAGRARYDRRPAPLSPRERLEVSVIDPPLLDPARWELAQRILGDRARAVSRREAPLAYHGYVWCEPCSRPMHAKWRPRTESWGYRCQSQGRSQGCRTGHLAARAVEETLDRTLAAHLGDPEALEALLALNRQEIVAEPQQASPGRLRALQAERERIVASWERGWRSAEDTQRRLAQVDAQIQALEDAAHASRTLLQTSGREVVERVVATFAGWRHLQARHKRDLMGPLVHRLTIARTGRARCRAVGIDLRVSLSDASRTAAAARGHLIHLQFPALAA